MVGAADVAAAVESALLAALAPAFGAAPVFVGAGPHGLGGPAAAVPYVVVYVLPPLASGPSSDPHADRMFTVQISSVGNSSGSAARIGDAAREALLAPWTPPAGVVLSGPVDPTSGQQPAEDTDTTTPVWGGWERFQLRFTPSGTV